MRAPGVLYFCCMRRITWRSSSLFVAAVLWRQRPHWAEKTCCLSTRCWREEERGSSTGWVQPSPSRDQSFHPSPRSLATHWPLLSSVLWARVKRACGLHENVISVCALVYGMIHPTTNTKSPPEQLFPVWSFTFLFGDTSLSILVSGLDNGWTQKHDLKNKVSN